MSPERYAIAVLVAQGKLDESHITLDEANELYRIAVDRVLELTLDQFAESNPCVFYDIETVGLPN